MGHCDQQSHWFLKLTPPLHINYQSSYMKVFASGGSVLNMCGEFIGVSKNHPVQRPPFISDLQWGAFRYTTDFDFRGNPIPDFTYGALSPADCWQ